MRLWKRPAIAAMFGFVGMIFGLIAIFIALGEVIPSVAARLGIYTALFLGIAAVGGFLAARPMKRTVTSEPVVKSTSDKVSALAEKSRKLAQANSVG